MSFVHPRVLPVAGIALTLGLAGCSSEGSHDADAPSSARPKAHAASAGHAVNAQVLAVIDGDTVEAGYAGRRQRVRLLGIDAPERTTLRNGHTECGGEDAKRATYALFDREQNVTLETDPSQDRYDKYGRLLAYVTSDGDDRTWQEQLLAQGWAQVYSLKRNPIARLDAFEAAAAEAKAKGTGVWAQCGGNFRRPF